MTVSGPTTSYAPAVHGWAASAFAQAHSSRCPPAVLRCAPPMGLQNVWAFFFGVVKLPAGPDQEQLPDFRPTQLQALSKSGIRKRPGAKPAERSLRADAYIISTLDHMAGAPYMVWYRAYCQSALDEAVLSSYTNFKLRAKAIQAAAPEWQATAGDVAPSSSRSSSSSSSSSQQAKFQQAGSTLLPVSLPLHLTVPQQREVFVAAALPAVADVRRGCGVSLLPWLVSWDTAAIQVLVRCCPGAPVLLVHLHVGGYIREAGTGSLILLPGIWKGAGISRRQARGKAAQHCPLHTQGLLCAATGGSQDPYDSCHFVKHLAGLVEAAAEGLQPLPAVTAAAAASLLCQLRLPVGDFTPAKAGAAASRVILLVDGAPQHTSAVSTQEIQEQGLLVVQTPPDSRDLNPIEDCWVVLKRLLKHRVLTASNETEMLAALNEVWASKPVRTAAAAAMQGYPQRLQQVRDSKYERVPGYSCRG